jgi:hypothetical protein
MKKYLVEIYIPAAGRHIDAFLPCGKLVGEATMLLSKTAVSICGESFSEAAESVLIDFDNGLPIDRNITVEEAGIRNAAKLILI